jgi:hypothetical protein
MKPSRLLFLALSAILCASAQTTRTFGSVIFPGGTAASTPSISRSFGSVVFPGGVTTAPVRTGPGVILPPVTVTRPGMPGQHVQQGRANSFRIQNAPLRNSRGASGIYSYPIYVPNYYDTPAPSEPAYAEPAYAERQPAPNITVIYPPQPVRPVVIEVGPDGQQYTRTSRRETPPAPEETAAPAPAADNIRYVLAFKDHAVYSAVAYWFDGDTLHYFTSGNTHNQASVALIDRELTERLNRELGTDFKMPAAK